jgi:glycosyltransferase 2 family protein
LLVALACVVLAAVLLIAFRWHRASFDWKLFSATLLGMRWPWLLTSGFIALLSYYGRALRWAVLIRHLNPHPNVWGLFSATAIGFTAIMFFGRPGELVRPYLISVKERLSFSSQMAAWFLERICDLLSALLVFGFALSQVDRSGAKVGPALRWVLEVGGYVAGVVGLACVLVFVLLRQFQAMRQRLIGALAVLPARWRGRLEGVIDSFILGVESTRHKSGLLWLALYTLLEWTLIALCYLALFRSFPASENLGWADVLILMGFLSFGSLVQIPGVGGGVQLVAVAVLTEIFRLPLEVASGIGLMAWIITFVVIVPIGLLLLVHEGLTWHRLKEMKGRLPV